MVKESEAVRVDEWINKRLAAAQDCGRRRRRGAIIARGRRRRPSGHAHLARELFGPAVAVTPFDTIEEAIAWQTTASMDWPPEFLRKTWNGR